MNTFELNIDGLVGPTHHYAGLSPGNVASTSNAQQTSYPAEAAHQGIQKMRVLHHLGLKQAFLPPQPRPNLVFLRQLGFTGNTTQILQQAYRINPHILSACFSASSMWTANAATVAPSTDTANQKVHFTPANLISNLHRAQEVMFTAPLLAKIFANPHYFQHHSPLPSSVSTSDEGAANHSRLCKQHREPGIHLFVYGKQALPAGKTNPPPLLFPARQTLEASQLIANLHQLKQDRVVFACQNPATIDKGVFHNDVISVANESLLLLHENTYLNQSTILESLQEKMQGALHIIEVPEQRISVLAAVSSYLFNSQIITLPNQDMMMIAPSECQQHKEIKTFIDELIADPTNPLSAVMYLNLKQSMKNGGGPACLRLRVVLNEEELAAMHQPVLVNDQLLDDLDKWVDKHYRPTLSLEDLTDPDLVKESFNALDELATRLKLRSVYSESLG